MGKLTNRIDFVYLFDVVDGNPNGDPDAGNLPRVDAETGMGLVTDVCLKRKIRNYVQATKEGVPGYDIFIKEKAVLNSLIDKAHATSEVKIASKKDKTDTARRIMCRDYFDVRTFGAVMTTGKNAGQVRGPVQLTFSRSIDPIVAINNTLTRVAVTKEEDAEKEGTMGRKATVPYGLYKCEGFISANLANQIGFTTEDLDVLMDALRNMFDLDRSAARGLMTARALILFRHDSLLGNAQAGELFERVKVRRREPADSVARSFSDYMVEVDESNMPAGVKVERVL